MNTDRMVRKIVVAGVLAAIAGLLGVTQLGFIPVPTPAGSATVMHIPAILGGVLEGPIVGGVIGLAFGIFSLISPAVPVKDPLVIVLPRIFIGVTAWLVYEALRRLSEVGALVVAAVVGTLTNTILVLGMAVLRKYVSLEVAAGIALLQGLPEIVVAAIIVVAVIMAWKGIEARGRKRRADL